jgi:hypothetical protein
MEGLCNYSNQSDVRKKWLKMGMLLLNRGSIQRTQGLRVNGARNDDVAVVD